jgi:hypothetical protein
MDTRTANAIAPLIEPMDDKGAEIVSEARKLDSGKILEMLPASRRMREAA